jgi:uncharacterized repeat protein (TIGR03806 family)
MFWCFDFYKVMTEYLSSFTWKSMCQSCLAFSLSAIALICAACNGSSSGSTATNQNPPSPPPTLAIVNSSAAEGNAGDSKLVFDVALSAAASRTVTANYATADGSASAASDYVAASGSLNFAAGTTRQTVSVTVHGDTMYEATEDFTVSLSGSTNATISVAVASGTINNDDTAPQIIVANNSLSEGDSGIRSLVFDVSLSAPSGVAASADFATSDKSATAGVDYASTSGTVVFSPGTTTRTISVDVFGDTVDEIDEALTLTLSGPKGATIAQTTATGTIIDDDESPVSVFGLDTRPDNQTCVAPARSTVDSTVLVVDPYPGLPNIAQPTKMLLEPVADPRWFVLQKTGELINFDPDNATSVANYMDLSGVVRSFGDGGLLGMAFHPDYPNTPEIFLSYTIDHSVPAMRSVISRFILDDVASPGAGTVEQVILQLDQDFHGHNGGDIAFGPDGFLYIGFGDGGGADDPNDRGQDTTRLLGSMLRIDVLGSSVSHPDNPYDIPPNNPFAGNAECGPGANADDCPEIYAWGFRSPWRWNFDADTGDLWLADVGQRLWEEIDLVERGGNYGWRCREGAHDFNTAGCGVGLIDPVSEYAHSLGQSITGGFVYRGVAIPELIGKYVFADFSTGQFWALRPDGFGGYTKDLLTVTNFGPTSFGVDQAGELYFTDFSTSRLRKIVPLPGGGAPDTIATLLSDTGCTDPGDVTRPYSGLLPYDINALFWSDGALKERFIGLPNGTTITRNAGGDWAFPNGTVIVKNFRVNGKLVETRHLVRHPDGVWAGYTYEWNSQQTEATRVQGGKTLAVAGQDWIFPSEEQCLACHTSAAGFSLGPETEQLNKDFTYPSTQRTGNQLETLDNALMFTSPLPGPASSLPALTNPADTSASLTDRARAYLHTNCAQCHRPGGPTPADMDLRYTTSLANTNACDAVPSHGDLGIANARLIAPGDSARSVLINRASRRDIHGMPPLGSNLVDTTGIGLLRNWIESLAVCN